MAIGDLTGWPGGRRGGRRGRQRGATAVEFALVAPIFFALVFSILEAGWFFFVDSAVDQATAKASRLIRTGQAHAGKTPADFFAEICDVVDTFGDCDDNLTVDVEAFDDFAALAADASGAVCRNSTDPSIEGAQFDASDYGSQTQIVRVRVCFLYKPINPAVGLKLGVNNDGRRELVALSIFRNEPF